MAHIQQLSVLGQTPANESRSKKTMTVTVLETKSATEGKVRYEGKDYNVVLREGTLAKGKAVLVVHGTVQGKLDASVVETEEKPTDKSQSTAKPGSPELAKAESWLGGRALTRSERAVLEQYIQKHPGSFSELKDVLQALGRKNLPVTETTIQAVAQALSPTSLKSSSVSTALSLSDRTAQWLASQSIDDLSTLENVVQKIQKLLLQGKEVEAKALLEAVLQKSSASEQVKQAVLSQLSTLDKLMPSVSAQGVDVEQVAETPLLKQALQNTMKQADVSTILQQWETLRQGQNEQTALRMTEAMHEAKAAMAGGRELAARRTLETAIQQLQSMTPSPASGMTYAQDMVTKVTDPLQLSPQIKTVLVTRVTQQMAEAKDTLTNDRRFMLRQLDAFQSQARPTVQQSDALLETTIRRLDQVLLKSDAMLYADMKTEKQLLQASSQLAEARKALQQGNWQQAKQTVNQVQTVLERVQFHPSEQKVQRIVNGEAKPYVEPFPKAIQPSVSATSAKQLFEHFKSMGYSHEADLSRALLRNDAQAIEQSQRTTKSIMQQLLLKDADAGMKHNVEQQLLQLTGQQLLNKPDPGALQHLFFSLPLLLGKDANQLQVMVKGRNQGERIDWENCNLTFLMETKKLGDLGIHLIAKNRQLTVAIHNDTKGLEETLRPFVETTSTRLADIGYNVQSIRFEKMFSTTTTEQQQSESSVDQPEKETTSSKGFDFSV
ncbi:NfeD family protein [Aureibacillus halotolerans]|uniref:Flagellar hook-length control protein FliK n=1 Tax=Aureibacillus halotolerans TaxID=1508390 RepID=A0A4R6U1I2_9BACI|nr:NfeD family protein [Aureibacillus halotolerans]TDQ36934.1 hypothetical protein EV213_11527 [Aureibacillus halotolerans]